MAVTMDRMIGITAKWSFFVISILSFMNAFVHLHLQFETYKCGASEAYTKEVVAALDINGNCIGRNLVWLTSDDGLDKDVNKYFWRQVFSLQPDIFFDIWTPFAFSIFALTQNFRGLQWRVVSESWVKCFVFIVVWMLFGVIGYGANWGVFTGFIGMLWLGLLYFIMIFRGKPDDKSVFDFNLNPCLVKMGMKSFAHNNNKNNNNNNNNSSRPLSSANALNNNNNNNSGGGRGTKHGYQNANAHLREHSLSESEQNLGVISSSTHTHAPQNQQQQQNQPQMIIPAHAPHEQQQQQQQQSHRRYAYNPDPDPGASAGVGVGAGALPQSMQQQQPQQVQYPILSHSHDNSSGGGAAQMDASADADADVVDVVVVDHPHRGNGIVQHRQNAHNSSGSVIIKESAI